MKKPIKFISSRDGVFLMVFAYLFIIGCCVLAIREWIINPQNIVSWLVGTCIIVAYTVLVSWYFIYFCFPHKSNIFLFQKDLIVQGTIEEFENIMYGKIVPKGLVSEQGLSE